MRLGNIEAYKKTFNDFFILCDKEAQALWEKYFRPKEGGQKDTLGKQGIGVYDVGQWLKTFSRVKETPEGMTLEYDPKKMLDDFAAMSGSRKLALPSGGITADDVKEI